MFVGKANESGGTIFSDGIIVAIGVEVPNNAIEPMLGVGSLATVKQLKLSCEVDDTLE